MKIDILQVAAIIAAVSAVDALPASSEPARIERHREERLSSSDLDERSSSVSDTLIRRAHEKLPELKQPSNRSGPSSPGSKANATPSSTSSVSERVRDWVQDHSTKASTPQSLLSTVANTPLHDPRFPNLFAEEQAKRRQTKQRLNSATHSLSRQSSNDLVNTLAEKKRGSPPWTPSGRTATPSDSPGSSIHSSPRTTRPPSPENEREATFHHWVKNDGDKEAGHEDQKAKLERFRPKPIITEGLDPGGVSSTSPSPSTTRQRHIDAYFDDLKRDGEELEHLERLDLVAEDVGKKAKGMSRTMRGKWTALALAGTLVTAGVYSTLPVKLPDLSTTSPEVYTAPAGK